MAAFWGKSLVRVKELIHDGLRSGRGNEFMYLTPCWLPKNKSGKYERITCDHAEIIRSQIIAPIHRGDYRLRHPETGEWISTTEYPALSELPPPWIEETKPARDTSKYRPKTSTARVAKRKTFNPDLRAASSLPLPRADSSTRSSRDKRRPNPP